MQETKKPGECPYWHCRHCKVIIGTFVASLLVSVKFPEFRRGMTGVFLEDPGKMIDVAETALLGDFKNPVMAAGQHFSSNYMPVISPAEYLDLSGSGQN